MSNRAVGLIGFMACAGITGVWGVITPDRLYTFLLAGGVVFFIHLKLGNVPSGTGEDPEAADPEVARSIYNLGYTQGLVHGTERARAEGGDKARTHTHKSHLPKAG